MSAALASHFGIRAQRMALLLVLFILWEITARLFGDPGMIASPSQVLGALGPRIFGDPRVLSAIGLRFLSSRSRLFARWYWAC